MLHNLPLNNTRAIFPVFSLVIFFTKNTVVIPILITLTFDQLNNLLLH